MKNIIDVNYKHTDENYTKIVEFLAAQRKVNENQLWEAGRTNFWSGGLHGTKEKNDPFFEENVHLWFDNDELVALTISEYGKNDMFIEIAVGYEELIADTLRWVNEVWNKKNETIVVFCFDKDKEKIKAFENDGFVSQGADEYKRIYTINEMDCEYVTPEGYTIGTFFENPNYESRVDLSKNVFNNTKLTKEDIISLHESNDYIKELEMIAFTPDGTYSAYCIGWRYPGSDDTGYIEPVGTHSEHRRKGLAAAVIKECFQRMSKMGIKEVVIATGAKNKVSKYLYDSLNPSKKRTVLKFEKALVK